MMMIQKIIANEHTAAGRAAAELATQFGIPMGGVVGGGGGLVGRLNTGSGGRPAVTDVSKVSDHVVGRYFVGDDAHLQDELRRRLECSRSNVDAADATIIVTSGAVVGEAAFARDHGTIGWTLDVECPEAVARSMTGVLRWLAEREQASLYVTGVAPGGDEEAYLATKRVLRRLFNCMDDGLPPLLSQDVLAMRLVLDQGSPESAFVGLVPRSLAQVYTAHASLNSSIGQALGLSTLALAAGGGVLSCQIAADQTGLRAWVLTLGACCAFMVPLLAWSWLKKKLRVAYDLYSSAVYHATVVHLAVGAPLSHLWFRYAIRSAGCTMFHNEPSASDITGNDEMRIVCDYDAFPAYSKQPPPKDVGQFCSVWRQRGSNLLMFWSRVLLCLGVSGLLAALAAVTYTSLLDGGG